MWSAPSSLALLAVIYFYLRNSIPFSWHFRVLWPFFRTKWPLTRIVGLPRKASKVAPKCQDLSPFEISFSSRHKATLDECDFMGHLSNSSYPKNLDIARSRFAANALEIFYRDDGWTPLAATTFVFHNEIPLMTEYCINSRIETWDEKWFYLRNIFSGPAKDGKEVTYCTSITRHCFKYGRKTIPPWFVLAYQGYSGDSDTTSPMYQSNLERSYILRSKLKEQNPLKMLQTEYRGAHREEDKWMTPGGWDVSGWERQRKERLHKLNASVNIV